MKLIRNLLVATATLAIGFSTHAGNITVKGSDTMVILGQKWAERYMQTHPQTKVQVTGGGSGVGIAALLNRGTDLANASRKMKPKEVTDFVKVYNKRPTEYAVALDGLSVYVNDQNPVKELSVQQLQEIFTGKIRNWKEVGGPDARMVVYSRENSSGTYEFFKDSVLKGKDFAASVQTMPGTAAVLQAVAREKFGIGYGGAAYGVGAKDLAIKKDANSKAVMPSETTVRDRSYPIWRHLYIYVNPAIDQGEIAEYLNWIRSDAGQEVVKDVGYYPLPDNLRQK